MTTFLAILTGGGLAALGGLLSGLVTNWLGDRRDQRKYQHEQTMALEARRQQRLEQAYIDLLSYLSHHQELAWSMGPLSEMSAPEPLSREERWRIEGLVTAYGSQEVRRLLEAWTRCLMKVQIANTASQLLGESQGLKPQLEEQAKQEQKAIPSYNEAVNRADAAIRERVRRELAGEV